jgi:transcriptional regulator with XRE-family HTH domain
METDFTREREEARALIREMVRTTGLSLTPLARKAGLVPSTLTRFMNADVTHLLTLRTFQKLSRASGVPIPQGITAAVDRQSKMPNSPVARLRALRLAWWGEDEAAAAALGVPLEKLQAQESGAEPMDSEYVLRVLSVTRTSPSWVYEGSLEDVSPLVAARLALVAPELIEGLDKGPGDGSKKVAGAGGNPV